MKVFKKTSGDCCSGIFTNWMSFLTLVPTNHVKKHSIRQQYVANIPVNSIHSRKQAVFETLGCISIAKTVHSNSKT